MLTTKSFRGIICFAKSCCGTASILGALAIIDFNVPTFAWDDKSINNASLNKICEAGILGNSFNGRGSGYIMYTFRGRKMMGNMTASDYNGMRKWFAANCPDGW